MYLDYRSHFEKRMRITQCQVLLLSGIILNFVILIYFVILQHSSFSKNDERYSEDKNSYYIDRTLDDYDFSLESLLTVVLREYEDFENQIPNVIQSIHSFDNGINIVFIVDKIPYPPISIPKLRNVHFVKLNSDPDQLGNLSQPQNFLKTEFTLFMPDGLELVNEDDLLILIKRLRENLSVKALALRTGTGSLSCPNVTIALKLWTVWMSKYSRELAICDFVVGEHAILLRTNDLFLLPYPFVRPVFRSLYIQFSLRNWTVEIMQDQYFRPVGKLLEEPHNKWKHKHLETLRENEMYRKYGIKQVLFEDGHINALGCTKDTVRCFDTIIDDIPDYIHQGKWTPPCCLKAVRETAHHVFQILSSSDIRYWLEGGSLLGAARNGDIIPWDYDVDIGIYKSDIEKCLHLVKAAESSFIDDDGFVWEKAIEGEFFRVQYSVSNRNHVDIFPFYSKNGIMTKDTWFKTHRQDREFPEHFLKPLTKIKFIGELVSAPNNIKNFLDFKFGSGVIKNPKYPNERNVLS